MIKQTMNPLFKRLHSNTYTRTSIKQRGAVLIIAMIMLLVLTILGIAGIDSSGMQIRMANNQRDRIVAMQAAEAGLMAAEIYLENADISADNIGNCTSLEPDCFEATCENGLCFTGVFTPVVLGISICTGIDGVEPRNNPLLDVFNDGNNRSVELTGSAIPAKVKYYIEFRCYTKADVLGLLALGNADYLFRITSYAETDSGRGRVMLQSTYSVKGI